MTAQTNEAKKPDPADDRPTNRPGALAVPGVHRDDVHPCAGIVECLTGEGLQVQAAETIADHIERLVYDALTDRKFMPRNVATLAKAQMAPARPRPELVASQTEAEVKAKVDAAVKSETAELRAQMAELLQLVKGGGASLTPATATPDKKGKAK